MEYGSANIQDAAVREPRQALRYQTPFLERSERKENGSVTLDE
jgi:hypothetical protein